MFTVQVQKFTNRSTLKFMSMSGFHTAIPSNNTLGLHHTQPYLLIPYITNKQIKSFIRTKISFQQNLFIFLQVALRVESEETKAWLSELKFSEFLRIFLFDDDAMYGSYFLYVEYLWNLAKDNSNILVLMFEDIIKVRFGINYISLDLHSIIESLLSGHISDLL